MQKKNPTGRFRRTHTPREGKKTDRFYFVVLVVVWIRWWSKMWENLKEKKAKKVYTCKKSGESIMKMLYKNRKFLAFTFFVGYFVCREWVFVCKMQYMCFNGFTVSMKWEAQKKNKKLCVVCDDTNGYTILKKKVE